MATLKNGTINQALLYVDPVTGEITEAPSDVSVVAQSFKTANYELDNALLGTLSQDFRGAVEGVLNSPAGTEAEGARYLVGSAPAGGFAAFSEDQVVRKVNGTWLAEANPKKGTLVHRKDKGEFYRFSSDTFASGEWMPAIDGRAQKTDTAESKLVKVGSDDMIDESFLQKDLDFGGHLLSGVSTPVSDTDAANKDYVDSADEALDTRLTTAEGDIDALEGRMTTAEGDIDALEGRMTTAEGDIDALETKVGDSADAASVSGSLYARIAQEKLDRASGDASTLSSANAYTDQSISYANAGFFPRRSVKAVATSNYNLSATTQFTIDGRVIAHNESFLLAGQTDATQNGVYVATDTAGTWSYARRSDMDGTPSYEVKPGVLIFVENGDTHFNEQWVITGTDTNADGNIAVGTEPQVWTEISKVSEVVAGAGLSMQDANGYQQLYIGNGAISTAMLADDAVTFDKIDTGMIGSGLLAFDNGVQPPSIKVKVDGVVLTYGEDDEVTIAEQGVTPAHLGDVAGNGLLGGEGAQLAVDFATDGTTFAEAGKAVESAMLLSSADGYGSKLVGFHADGDEHYVSGSTVEAALKSLDDGAFAAIGTLDERLDWLEQVEDGYGADIIAFYAGDNTYLTGNTAGQALDQADDALVAMDTRLDTLEAAIQPGVAYLANGTVAKGDVVGFHSTGTIKKLTSASTEYAIGVIGSSAADGNGKWRILADDNLLTGINLSTLTGLAAGSRLFLGSDGKMTNVMPTASGSRVWQVGIVADPDTAGSAASCQIHLEVKFVKVNA